MTRVMNPRNEDNKRIWRAVSKRARFNVIDDTGTQFSALMREVSEIMAGAAWKARQLGVTLLEAVSGVVRPALRRALAPGGDPLMGAKAIVLGIISGAGAKKRAALKVLSHTTRAIIRQTARWNGDVGAVVTGLVRGAISGSKRMGVSTGRAALAVVTVAIEEVYRIGSFEPVPVNADFRQRIGGP